jgi:UDP-2,4-diacetamido-2,4,6-trideoxy-beta-L-altropyranose hydrolase
MYVVFRADASDRIGTGHVMRCLSLAEALRLRGAAVAFVSRGLQGDLCDLVRRRGYETRLLSPPNAKRRTRWLTQSVEADARQTVKALVSLSRQVDWLVVDHYGLAARWESALRPHVRRLMVIDDLANRAHDCDVLLDQNLVPNAERRYHDLVPKTALQLLGPRFALLRPQFREARRSLRARSGHVRRILVSFGGTAPVSLTRKALRAVSMLGDSRVAVDVVTGRSSSLKGTVASLCGHTPNVAIHGFVDGMADLMRRADIAIGAAGTSTWERCCLSLPSIVVSMAANQKAIAESAGLCGAVDLGSHTHVGAAAIRSVLQRLATDPSLVRHMSLQARRLVDGRGAERVARKLEQLDRRRHAKTRIAASSSLADARAGRNGDLRLRRATAEDERLLFEWRNDPATRRASHHDHEIDWDEHRAWLAAALRDPNRRLFIAEAKGLPVGSVRADLLDGVTQLSWTVAPRFRGQGRGKMMVRSLAESISGPIRAEVKAGNAASERIAEFAGMKLERAAAGILHYSRGSVRDTPAQELPGHGDAKYNGTPRR